jgi:hypothetical protein
MMTRKINGIFQNQNIQKILKTPLNTQIVEKNFFQMS